MMNTSYSVEDTKDAVMNEPTRKLRLKVVLPANMLLLPALIATFMIGAFVSPVFLTPANLIQNIGGSSAALALVSLGLTLILITGNMDLSLESTVGFAPMVAALLVVPTSYGGIGTELDTGLGLLLTLALGGTIGLINSILIVRTGLNGFMVTLAMLIIVRGLTLGFSNGLTVSPLPDAYTYLGSTMWLGIPVSIWLVAAISIIIGFFLKYHQIGRAMYAIGGNIHAARASGIRVDLVRSAAFAVGGVLAALGGIVITGITGAVTAGQGTNMIFTAFAAVVIGGVSLQGGKGTVVGVLFGVLLLGTITNVLTLAQISGFWIDACYGVVILLALLVGRATHKDPV